jgi:hypothetical protein
MPEEGPAPDYDAHARVAPVPAPVPAPAPAVPAPVQDQSALEADKAADGRRSRQHRRGDSKSLKADEQPLGKQKKGGRRNTEDEADLSKVRQCAGTGGSEEWPPPGRASRAHANAPAASLEHQEDVEKSPWAPGSKKKRQPKGPNYAEGAAGLGMTPAPVRRTPDLTAPWDTGAVDSPGLPSIHGGFMSLGEMGPPQIGSRAPSRLAVANAGTPTPREEDSFEARHGAAAVRPWGQPDAPWSSFGHVPQGNSDRWPHAPHDPPSRGGGLGLGRRPDLSGYHWPSHPQ